MLILKYTDYYSCFSQFGLEILIFIKEFLKKLPIGTAIRLLVEEVIAYTLFLISKAISKGRI